MKNTSDEMITQENIPSTKFQKTSVTPLKNPLISTLSSEYNLTRCDCFVLDHCIKNDHRIVTEAMKISIAAQLYGISPRQFKKSLQKLREFALVKTTNGDKNLTIYEISDRIFPIAKASALVTNETGKCTSRARGNNIIFSRETLSIQDSLSFSRTKELTTTKDSPLLSPVFNKVTLTTHVPGLATKIVQGLRERSDILKTKKEERPLDQVLGLHPMQHQNVPEIKRTPKRDKTEFLAEAFLKYPELEEFWQYCTFRMKTIHLSFWGIIEFSCFNRQALAHAAQCLGQGNDEKIKNKLALLGRFATDYCNSRNIPIEYERKKWLKQKVNFVGEKELTLTYAQHFAIICGRRPEKRAQIPVKVKQQSINTHCEHIETYEKDNDVELYY